MWERVDSTQLIRTQLSLPIDFWPLPHPDGIVPVHAQVWIPENASGSIEGQAGRLGCDGHSLWIIHLYELPYAQADCC